MKFRVVMLVRDPRSMYHSRKKIFLNLENGNGKQMGGFMKVLKNECQAMAENFLSLEANNDISRKTYTLRYEVSYEYPVSYFVTFVKFKKNIYIPSVERSFFITRGQIEFDLGHINVHIFIFFILKLT